MIVVFGLNHRTADVSIREKCVFSEHEIPQALQVLKSLSQVQEVLLLSTCNRVEILADVSDLSEGLAQLKSFLVTTKNIPEEILSTCSYVFNGEGAVHHLFRVASSLDSMVVGEPQILGQLKEAFRFAVEGHFSGTTLNQCLHRAFHVAKRVRTETEIARHPVSVSSVAVDLASKIFSDLKEHVVLLVGLGEMMQEAASRLAQMGVTEILVTNRTHEKALDLARQFQGTTFFLERLSHHLPRADIVMVCTGASEPLITKTMVEQAMERRRHEPLFLIDLSVPRNIEEEVATLENVYLFNIDDLSHIAQENVEKRKKEVERSEIIVGEESREFSRKIAADGFFPLIAALHQKADEISRQELQKALKHFTSLTPKQTESLDAMSKSIAKKILHDPIHELKSLAEQTENRETIAQIIRRIFRL